MKQMFSIRNSILLICIVVVGCSDPAWYSTYRNDQYGFELGLPIGWEQVEARWAVELTDNANDGFRKDERYSSGQIEAAIRRTSTIAIFSPQDWDSSEPRLPMLVIVAESTPQDERVPEYLRSLSDYFGPSFRIVQDVQQVRQNGAVMFRIGYSSSISDSILHADVTCLRVDEKMLSFQALSISKDDRDLLQTMIDSVQIQ